MGGETDQQQPIIVDAAAAAAADAAAAAPAPAPAPAPAAAAVAPREVTLRLQSERAAFADSSKPANFLATLGAPTYDETKQKTPVDVMVALDVSGSMAGEKLELCIKTLQFVISQLRSQDRLGLVVFDTDVSVCFGLTAMTASGKQSCSQVVARLRSGSSTNLSGGLLKAMELMQQRVGIEAEKRVGSVLLFTDGQANVGIQDVPTMVSAVKNVLAQDVGSSNKFSVYTFGFGADHNPEILRGIAESGDGMYYFIRTAEDIPESFADALGGLLSTVAQNVTLRIQVPEGMRLGKIHSARPATTSADGRRGEVSFTDLQADETRDVLFEVYLPAAAAAAASATSAASASASASASAAPAAASAAESPSSLADTVLVGSITAQLSYFNLVSNAPSNASAECEVRQCARDAVFPINEAVETQSLRVIAAMNTTRAKELAAAHAFAEAQTCLRTAMEQLKPHADKSNKYASELMGDLKTCADAISSRDREQNYMQNLHQCQQQQQQQRSCGSGYSSYCTPMKARMKSMAKPFQ